LTRSSGRSTDLAPLVEYLFHVVDPGRVLDRQVHEVEHADGEPDADGEACLVVDPDGVPVEPVRRFLADFVARDNSPGSVRSYAYGLLRWWRWLGAIGWNGHDHRAGTG
jgi:hypothetical protein